MANGNETKTAEQTAADTTVEGGPTQAAELMTTRAASPAVLPANEELQLSEENEFIEFGSDEGIGVMSRDDVQMARLAISQGMSPQMSPANAAYLPDLKIGQMFNTLNGTIYGAGPIEIALVRRDPPRWVQFDENRNIVDKNVPPDDPRTEWRPAEQPGGKRQPPIATQFYDYVAVVLDINDIVVLSLARSGIKTAKKLNGLVNEPVPVQTSKGKSMKMVPLYAKRYRVTVVQAPVPAGQGGGTYGIFKFEFAGLITNRDVYGSLKGLSESMKTRELEFDRGAAAAEAQEEDTSFPHGANAPQADANAPTDM